MSFAAVAAAVVGGVATAGISSALSSSPSQPASASTVTGQDVSLANQNLPNLLSLLNTGTNSTALSQLGTTQATAPGYNSLYSGLSLQNMLNAFQGVNSGEASTVGAPGQNALLNNLTAQNQALNPSWYQTAGLATGGTNDQLASLLSGGLTGGQASSVERANNQYNTASGNGFMPNALTTDFNAMNYGNAYNTNFTNALNNASGAATTFQNPYAGSNLLNSLFGNTTAFQNVAGINPTNATTTAANTSQQTLGDLFGISTQAQNNSAGYFLNPALNQSPLNQFTNALTTGNTVGGGLNSLFNNMFSSSGSSSPVPTTTSTDGSTAFGNVNATPLLATPATNIFG